MEDLLWEAVRLDGFPAVFNNVRKLGLADSLPRDSEWIKRFSSVCAHNMRLRHEEAWLAEMLSRAGLRYLPIKGVGLVELLYPDLSWRRVVDIDLLLRPEDVAGAYRALKDLGLRDDGAPWNSEALSRLLAQPIYTSPELRLVTQRNTLVELHWDWVCERFPAGGPTYDVEAWLVYLCRHAGKHFWSSIRWICDIELYLRKFGERIDWLDFWKLAKRWGAERSCAASLHLCALLFGRLLRSQEKALSARSGRRLSRQAATALLSRSGTGWWHHPAVRILRVYNWGQRIRRCWAWLAPAPSDWIHPPGQRISVTDVWVRRYRRQVFRLLAGIAPSRRWRHRLEKAASLSSDEWRFLVGCVLILPVMEVAIRTLPSQRVLQWAATMKTTPAGVRGTREAVMRFGWLAKVAAGYQPFPVKCLTRSLALTRMLGRRGIATELKLGVRREDGRVVAHAWVEWGGQAIHDPLEPAEHFAVLAPAAGSGKAHLGA